MGVGVRELHVGEVDEDDESAELVVVVEHAWVAGHLELLAAHGLLVFGWPGDDFLRCEGEVGELGLGALSGVVGQDGGGHEGAVGADLGVDVRAGGVLAHGASVGGDGVVVELVADKAEGDGLAVGLGEGGGHGAGGHGAGAQRRQCHGSGQE